MEHEQSSGEIFEKFTWKIQNFSHLNVLKIYSEPFVLGGYPWRIILYPKGFKTVKGFQLSIYLEAMQTSNMSEGWSRDAKFKFVVFNQLNTNKTITEESDISKFNGNHKNWGFTSFMPLVHLHDPGNGYLVKDACIVGVEVFVCTTTNEKQAAKLTVSITSGIRSSQMEVEVPNPNSSEVQDQNVENIAPVCTEPTRKVRDMNDQACNGLQVLWEELEKCRFDLTWLEPLVQSALGVKSYVQKALHVEKLKDNMVALELEMEKLKIKLIAAELNLDIERELLKTKGN